MILIIKFLYESFAVWSPYERAGRESQKQFNSLLMIIPENK